MANAISTVAAVTRSLGWPPEGYFKARILRSVRLTKLLTADSGQ